MSRIDASGYFDLMNADGCCELRRKLCAQRLLDVRKAENMKPSAVYRIFSWRLFRSLSSKDYFTCCKIFRSYHARSLNSNQGWKTSTQVFLNLLLSYSNEIRSADRFLQDLYDNLKKILFDKLEQFCTR